MKLFTNVFRRVRQASAKKTLLAVSLFFALTAASAFGVNSLLTNKVGASCPGDPSGNSIIVCGEQSRTAFIAKVKSDPELRAIYAFNYYHTGYGLTATDYDRFITSAVPGTAYRDSNTIVVGGKVVATNVGSIGRWASFQGSNFTAWTIPGTPPPSKYYGNLNQKSMASASLPVQVLFDSHGKMQFAVMMSTCSNPAYGTPTTPPTCKNLVGKDMGGNRFHFDTTITPGSNGESVNKVVYNFGDGTPTVTAYQAPYAVEHIFTKSANVTATTYVNVPGGGVAVSSICPYFVKFTPPPATLVCDYLTMTPATIDNKGNQTYTLSAKGTPTNATIKSFTFVTGDGTTKVMPSTPTGTSNLVHIYAPGIWHASVSVTAITNTGVSKTVTGPNCLKTITVKPLECKPNIPVGSPQCKPSTLTCVSLTDVPGAIDTNGNQTFSFTAKATPDNATITSYTFNFNDGSQTPPIASNATSVTTSHTYAPGTWNATVTVTGKDASGNTITAPAVPLCKVSVTVKPLECRPGIPVGSPQCQPSSLVCLNLTDKLLSTDADGNQTYGFTATATTTNATITGYTFNFGDGSAPTPLPTSLESGSTAHKYAVGTNGAIANVTVTGKDFNGNPITAPDNPACSQLITVQQLPKNPNITITKTVTTDSIHYMKNQPVAVGQNFIYQLIVKNTGEKDLVNAVVTDTTPNGVTLISADLGTIANNNWSYTIPSLPVGASVTVNITAKVAVYVPGNLVNTACVNAPEVNPEQPNQPDSCDTATVTVTPPVTPPAPTVLVNTGAGSVISLFGASAIIATIAHRLFLSRRLARNQ